MKLNKSGLKFLAIFLIYGLTVVIYTYPLIFNLSGSTYGYSGDNLGSMHYFWWWKESFLKGRDVRDSFLEESPFGITIDKEPGTVFFYWPIKILTLVFNDIIAYNLVLLLSFPTAALSMYLLTRFTITQIVGYKDGWLSTALSILSGFIFSFSPYHFWKSYNHLDLSLIWPLPLFLLALLYLEKEAQKSQIRYLLKPILFLSFSWAATILTNFYYGFFLFLLSGSYIISKIVFNITSKRKFCLTRNLILPILFSSVLTVLLVLPAILGTLLSRGSAGQDQSFLRRDSYDRPLLNLVSLSSRPWDFILPSTDHPVLGDLARKVNKWIQESGHDFKTVSGPIHERTIYLGIINVTFLLLSIFLTIRDKNFREKLGFIVIPLQITSFIIFLISLPPYIFLRGQTLYLPSFFLYQIFPMFRTYLRLGIVDLMTTTLISSLVLSYFLARNIDRRWSAMVLSLLSVLAVFDFLNFPPFKNIDLKIPPSYQWLASQPGNFSVIEYPQDFNVSESLFFQRVYQKGVLNPHSTSPYFGLWEVFSDFQVPRVARILDALDVRYALFHKRLLFPQENPVDDLWYKRAFKDLPYYQGGFPGFKLVADFPETAVFKLETPENRVSIAVLTMNLGKIKIDLFPKRSWVWSGEQSEIYFVNLVSEKSVTILASLSRFGQESSRIKGVRFNSGTVNLPETGQLELPLENKLNVLELEKEDLEPIDLGDLQVVVEP